MTAKEKPIPILLNVPPALLKRIEARAAKEGRTRQNMIIRVLSRRV
jgi:hypothetical protein